MSLGGADIFSLGRARQNILGLGGIDILSLGETDILSLAFYTGTYWNLSYAPTLLVYLHLKILGSHVLTILL